MPINNTSDKFSSDSAIVSELREIRIGFNQLVFKFDQEVVHVIAKTFEYLDNCIVGFIVYEKNGVEVIRTNISEENIGC